MNSTDAEPPFKRHGTYYVALKLVVLAAALVLATKWIGLW